ncbi:MAG: DUF4340 domain-containing protein [Gammaproteobacteria bacterium]|nr:DUF4340 domain-containing protein [Gammaproteobacteria bacterium]
MSKSRLWLSGLLLLQILLATGIFISTRSAQSGYEARPLLAFDPAAVNKITVSSSDDEVTLLKNHGGWSLPGLKGLPANAGKLQAALEKLAGLQSTWPVTTTAGSHERFEVAADKFQRRLRLYQHDKLAGELFLGTSPGFRKVHVRPSGDNNVYAVAINTYDFPAREQDWLDKELLAVKDVAAISGPDYALIKKDRQWQFEDTQKPDENSELDAGKAGQLGEALASLRVTGVADKAPEFTAENTVTLDVTGQAAGKEKWQFQLLKKDNQYYVKRNDREQVFTLSQYDYDHLAGVKMADLKVAKKQHLQEDAVKPVVSNAVEGG